MRKNYLVLAAYCTAALFTACSSDDDNNNGVANSTPAKAAIAGAGANVCPAESVILATMADGATSFVWYNGDTKITGATGTSYEVTASGNYSAAGVNADGEGPRSDEKAVIIASCATAPVKAVIVGDDANSCPGTTVLLTAVADGATSYQWYDDNVEITGATAATYEVAGSGTYSVAGVNTVGTGEKSDPKAVTINACTVSFSDVPGYYNATGTPSLFTTPGASAWASTVTGVNWWYELTNFGDREYTVYIDYDDGVLTIDNYSRVASEGGYEGFFLSVYIQGEDMYEFEGPATVTYNPATRTLEMPTTSPTGETLLFGIAAFSTSTGEFAGFFTDGYANLRMVKQGAGSPGMSGTVRKTVPVVPGSKLRTFEGLKSAIKPRAVSKQ
jgi:hypothetical protein